MWANKPEMAKQWEADTPKKTRLELGPVKYPNGGGIAAMANKQNKIKEHEINVAKAKHELELAKINEKHSKSATPKKKA